MRCAAGELTNHIQNTFPNSTVTGVDPIRSLIDKAKSNVPNAKFKVGSILDSGVVDAMSYNMVVCCGVIGIFDEFEEVMSNLISWVSDDGILLVSWMFNEHPVDVWVRYRTYGEHATEHRESGWNIFSQAAVTSFLEKHSRVSSWNFSPFRLPIKINQNPNDPARTWTFDDNEGNRMVTNGLRLICNDTLLTVKIGK